MKNPLFRCAVPDSRFDVRLLFVHYALVERWTYRNSVFPCWLFYWNREPGAELNAEGEFRLDGTQAVLIPPYTKFSTRNTAPFHQFYVHFELPPEFGRVQEKIYAFPSGWAEMIFRKTEELTGSGRESKLAFLIRAMVFHYLALIPEENFLPPESKVLSPGISKVIRLLNSDMLTPYTNDRLARLAGLSLNRFYKAFDRELGMPPKRYQLNQRLEYARRLLVTSGDSIDEIASAAGFSDRFHFSKMFTRYFGSSPAACRKNSC